MSINADEKTSLEISETIETLLRVSRESNFKLWRDIARRLSGGSRRYATINVGKLSSLSKEGEILIVPGSVLGEGKLDKKVVIAGLRATRSALEKITASGSTFKSLKDLASENPKPANARIMR